LFSFVSWKNKTISTVNYDIAKINVPFSSGMNVLNIGFAYSAEVEHLFRSNVNTDF